MEDQLIEFETAKLAKEKGFDITVVQYYTSSKKPWATSSSERDAESNWNNGQGSYPTRPEDVACSAPTQTMLRKWLRKVKLKYVEVYFTFDEEAPYTYRVIDLATDDFKFLHNYEELKRYKTPEEALEEGFKEVLKLKKL